MKKENSIINSEKKTIPDDVPVNSDLTSQMLIDVVVGKNSEIWAFHDQPFQEALEWVEYDAETGRLVFITIGGRLNDLGIKIESLTAKYLVRAEFMHVYLIQDKVFYDYTRVPILIREAYH